MACKIGTAGTERKGMDAEYCIQVESYCLGFSPIGRRRRESAFSLCRNYAPKTDLGQYCLDCMNLTSPDGSMRNRERAERPDHQRDPVVSPGFYKWAVEALAARGVDIGEMVHSEPDQLMEGFEAKSYGAVIKELNAAGDAVEEAEA